MTKIPIVKPIRIPFVRRGAAVSAMRPMLTGVVFLCFLGWPKPAFSETDGFQEWMRLIEMVQVFREEQDLSEMSSLGKTFRNPEPLPDTILAALDAAEPLWTQLEVLARQTDWPRPEPDAFTPDYPMPFDVGEVFSLVHLVNFNARRMAAAGKADAAWAQIHQMKQCLRYLDVYGPTMSTLVAGAGRQLLYMHEVSLMPALSDEALAQVGQRQARLLENGVSPEERTRGELYFGLNGIDWIFGQLAQDEGLQEKRDELLAEWRQTEEGRAFAERVEAEQLLSFEPWRRKARDIRMKLRAFEVESFGLVPPRPESDWETQVNRLLPKPADAEHERMEDAILEYLTTLDPENWDLDDVRQIHAALGDAVVALLFEVIPTDFRGIDIHMRKDLALQRMVMVHVAAETYRRQHGEHPRSLEHLQQSIPVLKASHIQDPFVPASLRINREDGHWRVYSVGENLEDNGGRETPNRRKQDDFFIYPAEDTYP